jgi:Flp pilus assembly pilin Flp
MMTNLLALKFRLIDRLHEEEGQGMVEYALITGGISLVLVAAFITTDLTTSVGNLVTAIVTNIGY